MCLNKKEKSNTIKGFVEVARNKLKLALLGNTTSIDIEEIPNIWSKFDNTNDEWIKLDFPESENTSACIYYGKKGSYFPPHFHEKNIEHLTILNKYGNVEVITETYSKVIDFPNSICFDMGEIHAVKFIEDTKILCMWHPKMKGWTAEIVEEEK